MHWWGGVKQYTFGEYTGAIICTQQRVWNVTQEYRECVKCGLQDSHEIAREYGGWS